MRTKQEIEQAIIRICKERGWGCKFHLPAGTDPDSDSLVAFSWIGRVKGERPLLTCLSIRVSEAEFPNATDEFLLDKIQKIERSTGDFDKFDVKTRCQEYEAA